MGFSGLSSDARKLHKDMAASCLDYRYQHGLEEGKPPIRVAGEIASDCHWRTITEHSRPVGVGVLLLGNAFHFKREIQLCGCVLLWV